MEPFKPRPRVGPEAKLQEQIVALLRARLWVVKETHGNIYQFGFPDIFATHKMYGARWIEVKLPSGSKLTKAQMKDFPEIHENGSPIYFMTAASEHAYQRLFKPSDFWTVFVALGGQPKCS